MPRKPRDFVDEGCYHLIARGNNRLFIFAIPDGFKVFTELLRKSKEKGGVTVSTSRSVSC